MGGLIALLAVSWRMKANSGRDNKVCAAENGADDGGG